MNHPMKPVPSVSDSLLVVDCETTGIHPGKHHRIVELAMLEVDAAGSPEASWSSLLRVDRDLGPTELHGIRGRDLRDAPAFDEVLGDVLDRLAGRTIVAHNARFDCAFLEAELARCDVNITALPHICTMELAATLGLGGHRLRLADCREALGIDSSLEHHAGADAQACVSILVAYLRQHDASTLSTFLRGQTRSRWDWPTSDRRARCRERGSSSATPTHEPQFLSTLVESSESPLGQDTATVAPYLELLDRAIEDRLLSDIEQSELAQMASLLQLSADRVRSIHSDYLATLIAVARRDYLITDRERHDLILVGEALGIGQVEELLDQPEPATASFESDSLNGLTVCFTGALTCSHQGTPVTREIAQELAEGVGLTVAPRVTKKLDLLVVADPHSVSGKAELARKYGVRIIAEPAFWPMLGIEVD